MHSGHLVHALLIKLPLSLLRERQFVMQSAGDGYCFVYTEENPLCAMMSVFPDTVPVPVEPSLLNTNDTAVPLIVYVPASGTLCVVTCVPCVTRKLPFSENVPFELTSN